MLIMRRLVGGPCDGQTIEVDRGLQVIHGIKDIDAMHMEKVAYTKRVIYRDGFHVNTVFGHCDLSSDEVIEIMHNPIKQQYRNTQ